MQQLVIVTIDTGQSVVMFDLFWGTGSTLQATRMSTKYLFSGFTFQGINPTKRFKPLYSLYSVFMYLNVIALLPLAFNLSYFLNSNEMNTGQFLTSLQVAINVWGLPPKFITVKLNLKRLRTADEIMDTLDGRCDLEGEFQKIRNCIKLGNRLPVFFFLTYILYSVITLVSALIMQIPPYSIYIPVMDWHNTTWEFCVQSFIEFMLMNFTCLNESMVDVYAVIYIYILRTHMQILVERVRRLGLDENSNKDDNYKELVECIKDHKNLIRLLDTVSPVISVTIFVQFAITATILGITMINIFIFADTSAQIASIVYFLAVMVQTTPCCYHATCLLDDCDQLPLAILHCNWMHEDQRFRKMLIFFMQRSQKTMALTAMKLFPITLNTNLNIAKFSFTLYTLIKNLDFGQFLNK